MNRILYAILLLAVVLGLPRLTYAQTVPLASLGALELSFQRAQPVDSYPGQAVAAQVGFRQGEVTRVSSPGPLRQIEYLVEPGAMLVQGQPFAVVRGPEVHHFELNYESSQALLKGAERRFNSNKSLYESNAISASQWQEISAQYYALRLEHEHMRHFFELVAQSDDNPDGLTLVAPISAAIDYSPVAAGLQEGDSIALFVPVDAIRLEVSLPNALRAAVIALRAGDCELGLERVNARTDGYFVQAWSEPLPPDCQLLLGQRVLATPMVRATDALRVPASAVFQLQRQTCVLARRGDQLEVIAVELLGAEADAVIVTTGEAAAAPPDVLVSSVSAVQGVLLGLGGE